MPVYRVGFSRLPSGGLISMQSRIADTFCLLLCFGFFFFVSHWLELFLFLLPFYYLSLFNIDFHIVLVLQGWVCS